MEIGFTEILAILVIALLFFGPSKLPQMGKSIGEAIRGFKKGMSDIQDDVDKTSTAARDKLRTDQTPYTPPSQSQTTPPTSYADPSAIVLPPKAKDPVDS